MARKPDMKKGLGRGLSALLGDEPGAGTPAGVAQAAAQAPAETVPVDRIRPNPDQPRRHFAEADLEDLARSIATHGVLQPIILRPDPGRPGAYQIVAGERRWRAAQRAQLHDVPALVRSLDDRDVLEIAIVENVQRADLNPIEEAAGYAQLIESFGYTQDALARAIGKSRSHLANMMRLLALPDEVLAMVREGRLSAGHARAVLTAPDPAALAREAVKKGLTVRQLEAAVKAAMRGPGGGPPGARQGRSGGGASEKDADTRLLEGDLSAAIGMRVEIQHGPDGAGALRITYRSLEELDRLCQRLAE